jgi:hypothetical protein
VASKENKGEIKKVLHPSNFLWSSLTVSSFTYSDIGKVITDLNLYRTQ